MRASIDIGSNSLLFLVGEFKGKVFSQVESHAVITSLGRGLDQTGVFSEESMKETKTALIGFRDSAQTHGISPSEIIITATEAARVAKNSGLFFKEIEATLGLKVHVISSKAEAYFSGLGVWLGSSNHLIENDLVLMDIGGASTELVRISIDQYGVKSSVSLPLGALRVNEWRLRGEWDKQFDHLTANVDWSIYQTKNLVSVDGTMVCVGAILSRMKKFDESQLHRKTITMKELHDFALRIQPLTPEDLIRHYPMIGKRAFSLHSGVDIALRFGRNLGGFEYTLSTYGLRHGTLYTGFIEGRFLHGKI